MSKTLDKMNLVVSITLIAILLAYIVIPSLRAGAASTVTVNAAVNYQVIDGFGASDAFHTGTKVRGDGNNLTAAQFQKIIELLFSPTTGAGLTHRCWSIMQFIAHPLP